MTKKNKKKGNVKKKKVAKKLKIGFYSITGCQGCQLSVLFNEDEIIKIAGMIDIVAFPFIKKKELEGQYDFILMEGLVANKENLEKLKQARKKTKKLVALGACAHTGCVPAYRNFTLSQPYKHLLYKKKKIIEDVKPSPLSAFVNVDYTIPGCPPDKREIINFLKAIVLGKEPVPYTAPVCIECRRNGNRCLLDIGKPCLGPITRGGCNAVCVNGGFECWGCRGQTDDAHLELMINILKSKGYSEEFIKERMRTFVGMKILKDEKNGKNNKP